MTTLPSPKAVFFLVNFHGIVVVGKNNACDMEYKTMGKRPFLLAVLYLGVLLFVTLRTRRSEDPTRLRVVVNLVQLNVAVTDKKGNYVTSLRPSDFVITEGGIPQSVTTLRKGMPTTRLIETTADTAKPEGAGLHSARDSMQDLRWDPTLLKRLVPPCRRKCVHLVRYQQLHVPRFRFRARCYREFCALSGKRGK